MTREEALHRRVLQRARTVAIIGASPNPARHSHAVALYLKTAGYDVLPVCPDGGEIGGLHTYATLADIPGPIDLVVIFRRPEAVPAHIDEAAAKQVQVVWLQPGVWSRAAKAAADRHGITLVKERCASAAWHGSCSMRDGVNSVLDQRLPSSVPSQANGNRGSVRGW